MVIVAIPLVAFMPWSGTPETEQYSGEPTALISPSPILTLAPETEETDYIPDAAEVEALAKMLYGEARDCFGYGKSRVRLVRAEPR